MLGDPSSGPALIGALGDPEHKVREAAASALRKLKEARALEVLTTLVVADPHPDVRGACAQALGELDDPRALEALEFATRRETDVFTVILIERSILRSVDRREGKRQDELPSNPHVRLPSVYGIRLPPPRRTSSFICSAT
jgi:HEAT repeat protein